MKYLLNVFMIFLFSSAFLPFSAIAASETVKVNFTGSVKVRSCSVNSQAQNVDLGMWLLHSAGGSFQKGSETDWVEFEMQFSCFTGGRQIAGQLQGTAAKLDSKLFELDAGEGNAAGMAIQVEFYSPERSRWEASNANANSIQVSATSAGAGMQVVKFRARYKQLADVATAGAANASVTFVMQSN